MGKKHILYTGSKEKNETPQVPFNTLANKVDGFIVIDFFPYIYKKTESMLVSFPKPLVVLNYEAVSDYIDSVVFDGYKNTRRMMQFLVELGHTAIGYVGYPHTFRDRYESDSIFEPRFRAYCDALAENKLPLKKELVASIYDKLPKNHQMMERLFGGPERPTALLCNDDMIALEFYMLASSYKMKIPDDLTVVGYNGNPDATTAVPPLTTMATPLEEMGIYGVKRLVQKIEEKEQGMDVRYKIILPGRIWEGSSHRRIR